MNLDIKKMIEDNGYGEEESILIFNNPSYDTAFLGISSDNRAIYDFDKMVEYLVTTDGMSEEEAIEFIEYNSMYSTFTSTPIIMFRLIDFDKE